jgi:hypothetical protein
LISIQFIIADRNINKLYPIIKLKDYFAIGITQSGYTSIGVGFLTLKCGKYLPFIEQERGRESNTKVS